MLLSFYLSFLSNFKYSAILMCTIYNTPWIAVLIEWSIWWHPLLFNESCYIKWTVIIKSIFSYNWQKKTNIGQLITNFYQCNINVSLPLKYKLKTKLKKLIFAYGTELLTGISFIEIHQHDHQTLSIYRFRTCCNFHLII